MVKIPERVLSAWKERNGPSIMTTVNANGMPNTIWVNIVHIFDEDKIAIGDIVFSKTRENVLLPQAKGNYIWLTHESKSFQVKGTWSYEKSGAIFDEVRAQTDPKFDLQGVAVLQVQEVYEGAEKLA